MREAKDDGKKALDILRNHYAGTGKPRIISLYTVLTSLVKKRDESITDYVIRAENAANALTNAGELISDGLLIAMVMKGLPGEFKPFVVVMNQSQKVMTFPEFKVSLRNYEENERATSDSAVDINKVMAANFAKMSLSKEGQKKIVCFTCHKEGHKSINCWKNKLGKSGKGKNEFWCNLCKSSTHSDKFCRKRKQGDQVKQVNTAEGNESSFHNFDFSLCVRNSDNDSNVESNEEICLKGMILVDTGATSHIVNQDKFIDVDESYVPENHYIELADGTRTNSVAKKRGTILIKICDRNGIVHTARLENALYCPGYPQNIFSVRAATKKGAIRGGSVVRVLGQCRNCVLSETHIHGWDHHPLSTLVLS